MSPGTRSSLAVLLLLPAAAPAASHPVLEAFGVHRTDLPAEIYLVRTGQELPPDLDVEVWARRDGTRLVAADAATIDELARRGFTVGRVDLTRPVPVPSTRTWARITEPDPRIQELVDAVVWQKLWARINKLQNLGTRFSTSAQNAAAVDTLSVYFERRGLAVELHPFEMQGMTLHNVIALQPGVVHPDTMVVVSAHFDSVSEEAMTRAPGADDNASGVTVVQTVADLLKDLRFEYTIAYVCFNAEEQLMVGSQAWTADARARGLQILGDLDFDMVGYWNSRAPMDFDLEIEANQASEWLMDAITNAADLYTTMPYETHVFDGAWWGDHASFWTEGYCAVNHEEAWDWGDPDFNPAYHTTGDVLNLIDEGFMVGNTQLAVAAVATLARLVEGVGTDPTSVGGLKGRFGPR